MISINIVIISNHKDDPHFKSYTRKRRYTFEIFMNVECSIIAFERLFLSLKLYLAYTRRWRLLCADNYGYQRRCGDTGVSPLRYRCTWRHPTRWCLILDRTARTLARLMRDRSPTDGIRHSRLLTPSCRRTQCPSYHQPIPRRDLPGSCARRRVGCHTDPPLSNGDITKHLMSVDS